MKKSQSLSKKIVGISHRHQTYTKKTWKNQINNNSKHYIIIKGIIPSLNMNLPVKQTKHNNTNKKQKKFLSSNEIFERQMLFSQKLKRIMKENNNNNINNSITKNKKSCSSHKKFNLSEKINKSEFNPGDSLDINNNKLQSYSTKCDYAILGTKLFNDLKLDTEQMEQYLMSKYLAGSDNIISEIEEPAYISNNIEFLNTFNDLDIKNNNDIKNQKNSTMKKTTIDAYGKNSRNQNNKLNYQTKNIINIQTNGNKRFFTKFHTNLEEIKLKFQKNIKYNVGEEEKQNMKKVKNRRSKKKLPIIGERQKKSFKNYNNFYDKNVRSASMTKRMMRNSEQPRTNNLSWSKSKKLKDSSINSNDNSELYENDNEFQNESLAIINEINDNNNNNLYINNNSDIDNNVNYYQTDDKMSDSNKSFNSKISKRNNTPKNNQDQNNNDGPKKFISVKRFKKLNIPKLSLTNNNNDSNNSQSLKGSYSAKKMLCISDYVFIQELGKGSYAVVKLAIYKPTKEKFAIKIYNKQKLSNSQKNNYIKNEISVLRDLNNPNIMKLYKVIHTQHYLYLVMEYIDGISLLDVIQNDPKRRINESRCKKLFYQIVKAIAYCQKKNICHRDIKLENILVQKNDIIKIIDFGFAIKCNKDQYQKLLCGTLCYMPPEIVNREEYNPFYSDIWSLGVLLYAMLFGIFPFRGKNDEIIIDLINENNLIFPEDVNVSEDVKDLLLGIFVTEPCKRLKPDQILEHRWFSK